MNITELKRIRSIDNVVFRKTDAVLIINKASERDKVKNTVNLFLDFDSTEYDTELPIEEMSRCFSYSDISDLAIFLESIRTKTKLYIICDDNSTYWSLVTLLYDYKGLKATECVYLAAKELPNVVPCVWIIYLYDAYMNSSGLLTEEVENYVVTKKAFDRFGNFVEGTW